MGPQVKFTDRLRLVVENEINADKVLALYLRNRDNFEDFEPTRPAGFYTAEYHKHVLKREYKAYILGSFVRYYIYLKEDPKTIIGSVNFNFFNDGPHRKAEIGYKVDSAYQNRGIAYEACICCMDIIKNDYGIRRFDARIHPANSSSIKLAEKLGFKPICLEPQSANIRGRYVDLYRYSITMSDSQ